MSAPHEASEHAKAVADQAHGGVQHGDNDPAATERLKARFGIDGTIHDREPRIGESTDQRCMSARWGHGQ